MRIVIRADGGHQRGMGHIVKQHLLYDRLTTLGHDVIFLTQQSETVKGLFTKHKVRFVEFSGPPLSSPVHYLDTFKPDVVILDILRTNDWYIEQLKKYSCKIVTFDNTDVSAFSCDLIFNVMYCHDENIKSKVDRSILYEGYQYILMDEGYNGISPIKQAKSARILLTQGGADTTGKTSILMNLLLEICRETGHAFDVDVAIGPAFSRENTQSIHTLADQKRMFKLFHCPEGLKDLIAAADTVITAGGTTTWEVAACRRPMYIMANEVFEDETARRFKYFGFALYDGWAPDKATIKQSLCNLIFDSRIRSSMISAMEPYDMANGIKRVVDKLYIHKVLV